MRSHTKNHAILASFADECCATLARLIAYVGALALFAIVGLHFWDQLQFDTTTEVADQPGFTLALRSHPAFAVSSLDPPEKSESYEIFRHPAGGGKDVFHWGPPGEKPVAQFEIYRPGSEFDSSKPAITDLPARMAADGSRPELEAAGVIESKFGTIALFRLSGRIDRPSPALDSPGVLAIPCCKSPAGRVREPRCRRGEPQSAACSTG